jgi:OOP family OmpA-OmpF porin
VDHTVAALGRGSAASGGRGRLLRIASIGFTAWAGLTAGAIVTHDDTNVGPASLGSSATARVSGRVITLRATVPDAQARTALLTAANIAYGAANVVDRVVVRAGASTESWSQGFPALILRLQPIERARVNASGDRIVLSGVVGDAADRTRAVSTAKVIVGEGGTVIDRIVVRQSKSGGASTGAVRKLQTTLNTILTTFGVPFEGRGVVIGRRGKATLDRVAFVLRRASGVKIQVEGHTDSEGGSATNRLLSKRRADAVVAYLRRQGVGGTILTARGYGEADPLTSNTTAAGRAENRRVEMSVRKG